MSLNPSCNSVSGQGLPVLGDPPFPPEVAAVAIQEILSVLPEARIDGEERIVKVFKKGTQGEMMGRLGIWMPCDFPDGDTEEIKMSTVIAEAHGWTFRRAWYYWSCSTKNNPIPRARAEELNARWGSEVRFKGFSGGTSVDGDGESYNVDTIDGLRALVSAIKGEPQT